MYIRYNGRPYSAKKVIMHFYLNPSSKNCWIIIQKFFEKTSSVRFQYSLYLKKYNFTLKSFAVYFNFYSVKSRLTNQNTCLYLTDGVQMDNIAVGFILMLQSFLIKVIFKKHCQNSRLSDYRILSLICFDT